MLLLSHGLLAQGVSPSLRASHNLRSRSLQTPTCRSCVRGPGHADLRMRVHKKNERVLRGACEEDLITASSHPLPSMHSAARRVQQAFRIHRAVTRTTRVLEFNTWLNECRLRRSVMHIFVYSVVFVVILCLAYTNLVFAIKFDRCTCADWLTTCVLAVVLQGALQQPVILLMTGVLWATLSKRAPASSRKYWTPSNMLSPQPTRTPSDHHITGHDR